MASTAVPPTTPGAPAKRGSKPHLARPDLNPSFTKSIFTGELKEELIFPFPKLTPEDAEAFSRELERWVSRGTLPGLVMDADGTTVHAGFGSREPLMGAVLSILRSL